MKELNTLKETLSLSLMSEELETTFHYLDEYERLLEYKQAYNYIIEVAWETLDRDQRKEINKELNKVFKLNKTEQV